MLWCLVRVGTQLPHSLTGTSRNTSYVSDAGVLRECQHRAGTRERSVSSRDALHAVRGRERQGRCSACLLYAIMQNMQYTVPGRGTHIKEHTSKIGAKCEIDTCKIDTQTIGKKNNVTRPVDFLLSHSLLSTREFTSVNLFIQARCMSHWDMIVYKARSPSASRPWPS